MLTWLARMVMLGSSICMMIYCFEKGNYVCLEPKLQVEKKHIVGELYYAYDIRYSTRASLLAKDEKLCKETLLTMYSLQKGQSKVLP